MTHENHMKIVVASHHFKVCEVTPRARQLCVRFASKFVQYKLVPFQGTYVREPDKVYAAATQDRTEFRFHINSLEDFRQFLLENAMPDKFIVWQERKMYEPAQELYLVKPKWVLREDQKPAYEFISQAQVPKRSIFEDLGKNNYLLGLSTGVGKTTIASLACAALGQRLCLFIKATYLEKWVSDFCGFFELEDSDIRLVQGSDSLCSLLSELKDGNYSTKITIVSINTFANYIKDYEQYGQALKGQGYDLYPEEFFESIKAGVRVIDEVHQMFHMLFRLDMYTHVPRTISLSATLVDRDAFLSRMYLLAYPVQSRYKAPPPERYTDSFALYYSIEEPHRIRTEERGGRGYSHIAFEASIMRQKKLLDAYLALFDKALALTYDQHPMPGKKFIVFASTIKMCTLITEHLKKRKVNNDVARYVDDDDYEQMLAAKDGVVSTIGSAGTGLDIPRLTTCVMSTCISSIKANAQAFGRTRKIPNFSTEFVFFVCSDIPKQVEYAHRKKSDVLDARAKSQKTIYSGIVI